jgi:hypothetical protein
MSNLTDSEIFNAWKSHVSEDLGKSRFTAENNKIVVDDLIKEFKDNGVAIDDARSFMRQTIKFLVTEEGLKGGKSKRSGRSLEGWPDAVKMYYEAGIVKYYSSDSEDETQPSHTKQLIDPITEFLMASPIVTAWVEKQFGSLNQSILYETCRDSTALNLQMQDELFNSDWSQSGENIPDWAKKVLV